jgi:hypothetical protein
MEFVKTIREFHWVTKIVIALTILLVALFIAAVITNTYGGSGQGTNVLGQGFGYVAVLLAWILVQAFLILLIVIAVYMAIMAVKAWIEKYLDAMIAEQRSERQATTAAVAAMNEKFSQMEKRLEHIEAILEKVGE